jgi:hypothetical protein
MNFNIFKILEFFQKIYLRHLHTFFRNKFIFQESDISDSTDLFTVKKQENEINYFTCNLNFKYKK